LFEVVVQIAESVEKECVVAIKSTVPVGTNRNVKELIIANLKEDVMVHVVSNPEFISQGTAIKDTLHATRIVIGVENEYSKRVMNCLYSNFDTPILITDPRSAELIKYGSNNFLALKV
jgi:UDPglucose 6-dehydrogenase